MGYPDILYPLEKIAEVLGENFTRLKFRKEAAEIKKRHVLICHRLGMDLEVFPDAESFFELLGASLDVYDITRERGGEIVLDLNQPFPENSKEQYEHVLDVGTLEHCFNVAQAAYNAAGMVKVGGFIYHETPWNWGNHGFYSLHPTWFHDFYQANGFEVEDCRLMGKSGVSEPLGPNRFVLTGEEVVLLTTAKRLESKPFVHPKQRKYQ